MTNVHHGLAPLAFMSLATFLFSSSVSVRSWNTWQPPKVLKREKSNTMNAMKLVKGYITNDGTFESSAFQMVNL